MKLSPQTLKLLVNFSTINPNIVIHEGNLLKTMAASKAIVGFANVNEQFDKEVGIYDLDEFLKALNLCPDGEITLGKESISIQDERTKVIYRCSSKSLLTFPQKNDVALPSQDLEISITQEDLGMIRSAAGALKLKYVSIQGKEGEKITISAIVDTDDKEKTNHFTISLEDEAEFDFTFNFAIGNLKIIDGNYKVIISKELVSKWILEDSNFDLRYFIALDKSSKVD